SGWGMRGGGVRQDACTAALFNAAFDVGIGLARYANILAELGDGSSVSYWVEVRYFLAEMG
ncbi:hypothetical protein WU85_11755, partial [Corynebacterium striatum]